MEPGLKPGNVFVFQRGKPEQRSLHAGDVVLLRRDGETWIKRVYATAGARFWVMRELSGGKRTSRPIRPGDEARFERIARYQRAQGTNVRVMPFKVPHGKLFVVGDGSSSRDSREIGPVSESEVIGKVVTALPRGLSAMPEWVELSFPTPATFVRYGTAVPPNIQKRDAHRRALEIQRATLRARTVNAPGSAA
jgi:signal peptidase I